MTLRVRQLLMGETPKTLRVRQFPTAGNPPSGLDSPHWLTNDKLQIKYRREFLLQCHRAERFRPAFC